MTGEENSKSLRHCAKIQIFEKTLTNKITSTKKKRAG
jgi:hypothetical protein